MRRIIVIAAAGLSLAGCSSFSLDSFKSAPPPMPVQLDSNPPGADAVTSLEIFVDDPDKVRGPEQQVSQLVGQRGRVFAYRRYVDELASELETGR